MIEKKKPSLADVSVKAKPTAEYPEESDDDGGDADAAGSEVYDALKAGDVESFKTALRAFVKSC